ncbi:hypothetical protein LP416_27685 [Polaromonas sp. P2-4]|nr:hypothetical protein LP416_27685 [Polaromonas sp. P2-4]
MNQLNAAAWHTWYALTHLTALQVLEWSATMLTIYGAWLLANKGKHESWGFVLFLGANALWICFAWLKAHNGLMVQQLVLTAISLQGIWKGLIEPRLDAAIEQLIEESKL